MTTGGRYDLAVIGSGPAGQKGAIAAAKLGKRVVIADSRHMLGGVSLHTGTIPSKTLRETALSYVFAWCEAQVGAATRLIPLGQSDAQRVLSGLISQSARELPGALERSDDALSSTTPGQLVLSALHESQYSRLFRS